MEYHTQEKVENTTDRDRTGTPRRTPDFKSGASTNSATVASLELIKKGQEKCLLSPGQEYYCRDWISSIAALKYFLSFSFTFGRRELMTGMESAEPTLLRMLAADM